MIIAIQRTLNMQRYFKLNIERPKQKTIFTAHKYIKMISLTIARI